MPDTHMTVIGNVCDEPTLRTTRSGHAVTNFRVASTPRRYDRENSRWVDLPTLFVNVTCWRAMAEHVKVSIHKGQPIVVTGRYYCKPYEVGESTRIGYQLEAVSVGHDLTRGTAEFRKTQHPSSVIDVEADADGLPVDDSDRWLDLPDDAPAPAEQVDAAELAVPV